MIEPLKRKSFKLLKIIFYSHNHKLFITIFFNQAKKNLKKIKKYLTNGFYNPIIYSGGKK